MEVREIQKLEMGALHRISSTDVHTLAPTEACGDRTFGRSPRISIRLHSTWPPSSFPTSSVLTFLF